MKKIPLYILAIFGAIFLFFLLKAIWGGFTSRANPNAMVQKAKCVANCRKDNVSDNCDNYCTQQMIQK